MRLVSFLSSCILTAVSLSVQPSVANEYLFLGTGNVSGIYYPTGNALCRMLEKSNAKRKVSCTAESSGGSTDNVQALREGDIDIAIVQSDVHWQAYQGEAKFAEQPPYQELRSLFSLYPEAFTVLADAEHQLALIGELAGKDVNIGPPGSGQHATMKQLMAQFEWQANDFAKLSTLKPDEQSRALCSGKVDAIVYVVGHPNTSITEATNMCDSQLLSLEQSRLDQLLAEHQYFRQVDIPGGTYHGNPQQVTTFGVSATLVADQRLSEQTVYHFVSAVFENIETLRSLHPALSELNIKEMINTNLTAPLHPGAVLYYRENGWLD